MHVPLRMATVLVHTQSVAMDCIETGTNKSAPLGVHTSCAKSVEITRQKGIGNAVFISLLYLGVSLLVSQ